MIIKSTRIYTEEGMKSGCMEIADGKFEKIQSCCEEKEVIDYGDLRIIPGIFDTHTHGICGYSLMGITQQTEQEKEEEVRGYLKGEASKGTTCVFPTASTDMFRAIVRVAGEENPGGAQILGIHSEGPWLNRVGEKGIKNGWPQVDMETAEKMVKDAGGMLRLVSAAPEIPGIQEIAEYFLSQGIVMGCAHSEGHYEEIREAYERHGYSVSTHTGNVMTGMHHRDVGGLGAALLNDQVMSEVICDGMHICPEMLRIFFRIKNPSRFMMVSDSTPLGGAPVGTYKGWDPSMTQNVTKEGFILSDTGRLCGSGQPVLFGIGVLAEKVGLPMETIVRMAALNPAVKYGFEEHKGSIREGKDADFVVISDDYHAVATYVNGVKVYDLKEDGTIFSDRFVAQNRIS